MIGMEAVYDTIRRVRPRMCDGSPSRSRRVACRRGGHRGVVSSGDPAIGIGMRVIGGGPPSLVQNFQNFVTRSIIITRNAASGSTS